MGDGRADLLHHLPENALHRALLTGLLSKVGLWNAEARAYLGFALAQSGRYAEAGDAYRESLRLGPDSAGIHYQISVALGKLGRLDEAESELLEARRQEALHPGAGR